MAQFVVVAVVLSSNWGAGSSFHVLLASRTPAGAVAASTTTSSKIDCDGDDDLWVGRLPFATKAANKW